MCRVGRPARGACGAPDLQLCSCQVLVTERSKLEMLATFFFSLTGRGRFFLETHKQTALSEPLPVGLRGLPQTPTLLIHSGLFLIILLPSISCL